MSRARGALSCAIVGLSTLVLGGCAHGRCPTAPITSADMALHSLRAPRQPLTSLRAEATVDQRGKDGRVKGRVLMFAERPAHLRFDVMTQFGPALVLTADGARLALNDLKQGRFFAGPTCAQNIARLIGVALAPEDVVSVLFGEAPLLPGAAGSVRCGDGAAYVLSRVSDEGLREELELGVLPQDVGLPAAAQHTYLRAVSVFDAAGKPLYRVRYEDYRDVPGKLARFPYTIRIEDLARDADALVRFRSIDLNVRVPEGAFAQDPAPGVGIEEMFCE